MRSDNRRLGVTQKCTNELQDSVSFSHCFDPQMSDRIEKNAHQFEQFEDCVGIKKTSRNSGDRKLSVTEEKNQQQLYCFQSLS